MHEVIMPKLGLTMEYGTIARWLKREGDRVEKGEKLLEVETDKSLNEVEAASSGVVEQLLFGEGDTVPVLQVIAYIGEPTESTPRVGGEPLFAREEPVPSSDRGPAASTVNSHFSQQEPLSEPKAPRRASPRAARLAAEKRVSLEEVRGTGAGGRITEKDILDFLESRSYVVPSRIQTIAAERVSKSFATVPHFYLRVQLDASKLVEWRERLVPIVNRAVGVDLTYTDMLVAVVAKALRSHPRLNSSWEDGRIRLAEEINIGIATAADDGLVVPVIKHADQRSVVAIAQDRACLTGKARQGRLRIEDLEGGTFTISNLGMFGIDEFDAIINPPQSAILAAGQITDRPVARGKQVLVVPTLRLGLSADHRVVDGVIAAEFLQELKAKLEEPDEVFTGMLTQEP